MVWGAFSVKLFSESESNPQNLLWYQLLDALFLFGKTMFTKIGTYRFSYILPNIYDK